MAVEAHKDASVYFLETIKAPRFRVSGSVLGGRASSDDHGHPLWIWGFR